MITTLEPKRLGNLYLREIEEGDYLDYFEIGKDPITVEYVNWGPFKYPKEALYAIQEIFNKRPEEGLPKGYAITKDSHMIGMIDFHTENKKRNSIEIGYFLKREYWGKGIMTKCLKYMIHLAYSLGFDAVSIGSFTSNERSIRLIESLGFHLECRTIAEIEPGIYKDAKYYIKYKNEEW